jgi:hypothetical protein
MDAGALVRAKSVLGGLHHGIVRRRRRDRWKRAAEPNDGHPPKPKSGVGPADAFLRAQFDNGRFEVGCKHRPAFRMDDYRSDTSI